MIVILIVSVFIILSFINYPEIITEGGDADDDDRARLINLIYDLHRTVKLMLPDKHVYYNARIKGLIEEVSKIRETTTVGMAKSKYNDSIKMLAALVLDIVKYVYNTKNKNTMYTPYNDDFSTFYTIIPYMAALNKTTTNSMLRSTLIKSKKHVMELFINSKILACVNGVNILIYLQHFDGSNDITKLIESCKNKDDYHFTLGKMNTKIREFEIKLNGLMREKKIKNLSYKKPGRTDNPVKRSNPQSKEERDTITKTLKEIQNIREAPLTYLGMGAYAHMYDTSTFDLLKKAKSLMDSIERQLTPELPPSELPQPQPQPLPQPQPEPLPQPQPQPEPLPQPQPELPPSELPQPPAPELRRRPQPQPLPPELPELPELPPPPAPVVLKESLQSSAAPAQPTAAHIAEIQQKDNEVTRLMQRLQQQDNEIQLLKDIQLQSNKERTLTRQQLQERENVVRQLEETLRQREEVLQQQIEKQKRTLVIRCPG